MLHLPGMNNISSRLAGLDIGMVKDRAIQLLESADESLQPCFAEVAFNPQTSCTRVELSPA